MFKKMILIVLPLLLTACGMEYEGEIENYSYSDLQDESEMGFRSEGSDSAELETPKAETNYQFCYKNCCARQTSGDCVTDEEDEKCVERCSGVPVENADGDVVLR